MRESTVTSGHRGDLRAPQRTRFWSGSAQRTGTRTEETRAQRGIAIASTSYETPSQGPLDRAAGAAATSASTSIAGRHRLLLPPRSRLVPCGLPQPLRECSDIALDSDALCETKTPARCTGRLMATTPATGYCPRASAREIQWCPTGDRIGSNLSIGLTRGQTPRNLP